jgi:hypothetical protein
MDEIRWDIETQYPNLKLAQVPRWLAPEEKRYNKETAIIVLAFVGTIGTSRLWIRSSQCRITEYHPHNEASQCTNCQLYGNPTPLCPETTPTCAVCAGDHSTQGNRPQLPDESSYRGQSNVQEIIQPLNKRAGGTRGMGKTNPYPTNKSNASSRRTNQDTDTTNYRTNLPRVNRSSSDTLARITGQTGSGARRRGNGWNSHHCYQTPSKRQYRDTGNPTLNNNQNPKTTSNVQCHIKLLNCPKNKPVTLAAIHSFASQPECFFFCLQEQWCGPNKSPLLHPDFDLFTPTPLSPKCATYIRCNKGLSAHTTFTYKDSFIGTHISLSEAVKFTFYSFYSPGHPNPWPLLDDFRPSLPCILLGDFNAYHEWWYRQLAVSTRKTRAFHAHRGFSKIIVDWLEDNNFTLHNTPGVRPTSLAKRTTKAQ